VAVIGFDSVVTVSSRALLTSAGRWAFVLQFSNGRRIAA
jgi:hypothetical protein